MSASPGFISVKSVVHLGSNEDHGFHGWEKGRFASLFNFPPLGFHVFNSPIRVSSAFQMFLATVLSRNNARAKTGATLHPSRRRVPWSMARPVFSPNDK